jgi:hypothetical protein
MRYQLGTWLLAATFTLGLASSSFADEPEKPGKNPSNTKSPVIQLALLLDTSNSMDGLIGQAKAQLWKVVNELSRAKKGGKSPDIFVALYEYGNDRLSSENGYVRRVLGLTEDLDKVSEQLFALRTNGGSEYCGHVISKAIDELTWSPDKNVYKTIFIAGNEAFSQGPTNFRESCKSAVERDVLINTIFCGRQADGISGGWKDGAILAEGSFMNIDQNRVATHLAAPQDKAISNLGVELNKTYLPFGRVGTESQKRQTAQDKNAGDVGNGSSLQRARWKSSKNYKCDTWDLVDAVTNKKLKLKDLKEANVPAILKKLNLEERQAKIESLLKERKAIQAKIRKLDVERQNFVAAALKKVNNNKKNSLDEAMLEAVRKQAAAKKFKFGQ